MDPMERKAQRSSGRIGPGSRAALSPATMVRSVRARDRPACRTSGPRAVAGVILLLLVVGAAALALRPIPEEGAPRSPPSPEPLAEPGHSDDFMILGRAAGAPGLLSAVHHGHFPAYPSPVGAITGWNWSGANIDPNVSVQPGGDIAQGRDGFGFAVYTTYYPNGTVLCMGNPETQYRGDLIMKRWNGTWGPAQVIMPGDNDVSYTAPSMAYDARGSLFVSFGRNTLTRDGSGCTAGSIGSLQFGIWRGADFAKLAGPTVIWPASLPPLPKISDVVILPKPAPLGALTANQVRIFFDEPVPCPPSGTIPFWFRVARADWGGSGITGQGPVPGSPGSIEPIRTIASSASSSGETVAVHGATRDPDAFVAPCNPDGDEMRELWFARWNGLAWNSGMLDQTNWPTEAAIAFQFNDTATIVYNKNTGGGPDLWYTFFHWGPQPYRGFLAAGAQAPKIASDHYDRTVAIWQGGGGVRNSTFTTAGWGPIGFIPLITDSAAIASHASSPSTPLASWTFFSYMCEDTYPPLMVGPLPAADVDIQEMQQVGSTAAVNIATFLDKNLSGSAEIKLEVQSFGTSNRFQGRSTIDLLTRFQSKFGSPGTLEAATGFFMESWPANDTLFNIWGHGMAWRGVCVDAGNTWSTVDDEFLNMTELMQGLGNALGPTGVSVLGFDACCMSNFESLYQLRLFADYAAVSETVEPNQGWPYDDIFLNLIQDWRKTPSDLAEAIVADYRADFLNIDQNNQAEMLTAIDLGRLRTGPLPGAVDMLGKWLDKALPTQHAAINGSIQNASKTDCGCPPPEDDLFLDLKNLSKEYARRVPDPEVQAAAQAVIDEVPNVAYAYWNGSDGNPSNRPPWWNDSMGTDYHGISIYHSNGSYDVEYNDTAFWAANFWSTYIWNFNQMMSGGPVIVPEFGSAVVAVATLVSLPLLLARRRRSRKGNSP